MAVPEDNSARSEPFGIRYFNKLLGDWSDWNSQLPGYSGMVVGASVSLVVLILYSPRFGTPTVMLLEITELLLFGVVAAVLDDLFLEG